MGFIAFAAATAMLGLVLIAIAVQRSRPAMPVYGLTVIWAWLIIAANLLATDRGNSDGSGRGDHHGSAACPPASPGACARHTARNKAVGRARRLTLATIFAQGSQGTGRQVALA
jgi:hypothetical protein